MNEQLVERGPADQTRRPRGATKAASQAAAPHSDAVGSFADEILPHLDSAYNLARWLVRDSADAEDIVQEACVRALRYFAGFRGGDARAWLLTIVRHTFYRSLQKNRGQHSTTEFDESIHTAAVEPANPETLMLQDADGLLIARVLEALPVRFREILVLRELEGLTYKEIADVVGAPIGTVMSSLSRARDRFRRAFNQERSRSRRPGSYVGST